MDELKRKPVHFLKNGSTFVAPNEPFVGDNDTLVRPFIGKKLPFNRKQRFQLGFTLIELLTVVIIVGILAAIAAPTLRDMSLNNQLVTEVNDLLADLLYMRSEAIKRSTDIYMCKTADPNAASPVCDTTAANPWSNGWLIYVNGDGNIAFSNAADTLLRVGDGFSGNGKSITTTGFTNDLIYSRLGLLKSGAGNFNICDSRGASFGKLLEIGSTGRPKIVRNTNPSC